MELPRRRCRMNATTKQFIQTVRKYKALVIIIIALTTEDGSLDMANRFAIMLFSSPSTPNCAGCCHLSYLAFDLCVYSPRLQIIVVWLFNVNRKRRKWNGSINFFAVVWAAEALASLGYHVYVVVSSLSLPASISAYSKLMSGLKCIWMYRRVDGFETEFVDLSTTPPLLYSIYVEPHAQNNCTCGVALLQLRAIKCSRMWRRKKSKIFVFAQRICSNRTQ